MTNHEEYEEDLKHTDNHYYEHIDQAVYLDHKDTENPFTDSDTILDNIYFDGEDYADSLN